VVVNQLRSPWRNAVVLFGLLCGAFFTAVIGTMGAKFVIGLMYTDQVSPDLEIPSWFVYLCIPLGSYLMCFRFLQVAYAYGRTGELPHHDHAHVEGVEIEEPGVGAAGVTR
jgi:C4-dicarboxylate transporter DctQ subunit